jgi:hypothetical protein
MTIDLNLIVTWPYPTAIMAQAGLAAGQPILALPLAAGLGTYWWMNGGFAPVSLAFTGKAYLIAGVAASVMFVAALELDIYMLKEQMGAPQAGSAVR